MMCDGQTDGQTEKVRYRGGCAPPKNIAPAFVFHCDAKN